MDRIRNEQIRGRTKVGEISKKMQESKLKWYRHVMRMVDECVEKRDEYGCGGEEKERGGGMKRRLMTKCGPLEEGTVGPAYAQYYLCVPT